MQAANVDATISRLKHQQAQQEERKRLAAAAAAAAQNPVKQENSLDPDFSPRLGSGQLDNPEADDRAGGAAQMAHQMSQVCHAVATPGYSSQQHEFYRCKARCAPQTSHSALAIQTTTYCLQN